MNKLLISAMLSAMAAGLLFSCTSDDEKGGGSGEEGSDSFSYCLAGEQCLYGPFTLKQCGDIGGLPSNSCNNGGGSELSSSSDGRSSSPNSTPRSSSSACTAANNTQTRYCSNRTMKEYGFVTDQDNNTYKTVVIETQTWMAENLNYAVEGSKCYGEDGGVLIGWDDGNPITNPLTQSEVQANCTKYGRLYDWATAMNLPSSCNSSACSGQINNPHRGICPSGWHLPTQEEWNTLSSYIQSVGHCFFCDAKLLKAVGDWNSYSGASVNGMDEYGFAALPGGGFDDVEISCFLYVGEYGYWWSVSESKGYANQAYVRLMSFTSGGADWFESGNNNLFSVRCVKD